MSWPLASFTLLAGVLLLGWLAYERSRPSARTVALVATLTALTALGRDAFAALPDVKPITAMTFVVGYVLGPLPGFVVGSIGMLVSNMMLGQGPYTPWQMAAWGGVGVLGAFVRKLSGGRLRRVPLALGCALAALLAKETMDLYTWTVDGVYTPSAFLLVQGQALPFDVADVVSTFLFGLLFGSELARLLARARTRMSVQWREAGAIAPLPPLLLCAALAALALRPAPAHASIGRREPIVARHVAAHRVAAHRAATRASATASTRGGSASAAAHRAATRASATASTRGGSASAAARLDAARGVAYLASAQDASGGFGAARGSPSSSMFTSWAALGLAAAGAPPTALHRDGRTPLSELQATAHTVEAGAGGAERTMLALHACGASADSAGGVKLLSRLLAARRRGSFEGQVNLTAFAIFALRAAGYPRSAPAIRDAAAWLARQQNVDGGFSFGARGDPSDVDDTAAAIEALVAAGTRDHPLIARAVSYLRSSESPGGGFPQERGGEPNAQSSAWAVQALIAAGAPVGLRGAARADTPVGYLERLVEPDGSVRYSAASAQTPVWVTAEALAAFSAAPLPALAPVHRSVAAELGSGAALDGTHALAAAVARMLPAAG
ncbi:MAG: ECF transporter S component [Solirubrobacteraceae bacterium]